MHRKFWFLVSAAVAVFALTGTAAAMGSTSPSVVRAAPFHWQITTPKQRAVSHTLNFGMEQDVSGFDSLNANQDQYWAVVTGETPVLRGNYIVDNKGNYHLDLASSVKATQHSLTITIRNNAFWYWQGHAKAPVTADDYIYTWQQIMKPSNNATSVTGYSNITSATKVSSHKVIFHWSTPFADYQDLFGFILPKAAFSTWDSHGGFNSAWTNCVCSYSGQPVSDGPYYLSNYTVGAGVTLKPTPAGYWYGTNPQLTTVNFKLITDNNAEYTAYNGGEIDAMAPAPNPSLSQYVHKAGTVYSVLPSFTQEHLDINLHGDSAGSPNKALLGQVWMRQAIMEGIDRQGIINAVFVGIAKGLKPLNNPVWNLGTNATGKNAWMAPYNYNPGKAIALLKKHHCTGGPTKASNSNNKIWTCGGHQASFNFKTTTRATRTTSSAIIKANLQAIGIKISVSQQPSATFFGTTTPNKDFDIAEYAWVGGVDPSGFDAIYQCQKGLQGGQNYKNFCVPKVDSLIKAGDSQLNATKRIADYQNMAKIVSADVPVIPLYGSPTFLIYNSGLHGMGTANNPTQVGPTWNIETWHW